MKYKVLYDTQINGEHKSKDSVIEFPYSTDSNYIQRLVNLKVIELLDEETGNNERLELEEKAKSLGISFNSKTKNETIIRKIQEIEAQEIKEN